MNQLPLIDISGLFTNSWAQRKDVADAIGDAARTFGFFRISGHGISRATINATYEAAEEYFAQSDEEKRLNYIGHSRNHRGYVPFTEKGDYPDEVNRSYEAFDLGLDLPHTDPDYMAGCRVLGPNVWPDLKGFKRTIANYYNQVSAVGRLMCTSLEEHLGLPKGAMTSQLSKPISQLRLLHYVRQSNLVDNKSVNMGAHTDYECLTLLHTRNQGLQVMTQDDQWIDVPVDQDVFVVNIGDMLEAWSNGIFRSTPHRVINLKPERFSLPYFVAANYDAVIKPFDELITPERPAQYEPFTAGAHLERMLIRDFPYLRAQAEEKDNARKTPIMATTNPFENRLASSAPT